MWIFETLKDNTDGLVLGHGRHGMGFDGKRVRSTLRALDELVNSREKKTLKLLLLLLLGLPLTGARSLRSRFEVELTGC